MWSPFSFYFLENFSLFFDTLSNLNYKTARDRKLCDLSFLSLAVCIILEFNPCAGSIIIQLHVRLPLIHIIKTREGLAFCQP